MTTPDTIARTDERFIIDYGDTEFCPARMVDVDGLDDHLSKDIQYSTYGYADGPPAVYRYVPGSPPQLEPLTLNCVEPGKFDEDDWARSVWELTGPDGTRWATMGIRVDGRA